MTARLSLAVAAIRKLDPARQDEIASITLSLAGNEDEPEEIDPEHLAYVLEGLGQTERGEFATGDQVQATFARFDHPKKHAICPAPPSLQRPLIFRKIDQLS